MSDSADQPHDRYFKDTFSQPDILADFLTVYLPDDLRAALDLSSLQRQPDSYTDDALSEHFADLLFTATLHQQPVQIALLLEHKSYTEPYVHFQLNRYMHNVWQHQLEQKQPLLPILPIVVYHGTVRWKKRPMASYFQTLLPVLQPYVPTFDYILIDLKTITDHLPRFATDYARLTGVLLQYSRKRRSLEHALLSIADGINRLLAHEQGERFFRTSLIYLNWVTKLTRAELVVIFRSVSEQAQNYNMSLYEQLIQEGRQEGRQQGRQEGQQVGLEQGLIKAVKAMRKLNMDAQTIAVALELPLDQVQRYIAVPD